jgi:hypothetical protein
MPAEVPEIGTTVKHAGQRWIVAAIENDRDTPVVVLRPAAKEARFAVLSPRAVTANDDRAPTAEPVSRTRADTRTRSSDPGT